MLFEFFRQSLAAVDVTEVELSSVLTDTVTTLQQVLLYNMYYFTTALRRTDHSIS